ncbi:MAG: hypothetical protein JOY61_08710 [Chloroflexi bacterium]|nr:hypothetical protein [Chloroflexota bacterium]
MRITRAAALGQPSSPVAEAPRTDTSATVAPVPRLELWRAALKVFLAYPLLGVGPDNFRHVYGSALGLDAWDQRVDANNLYL